MQMRKIILMMCRSTQKENVREEFFVARNQGSGSHCLLVGPEKRLCLALPIPKNASWEEAAETAKHVSGIEFPVFEEMMPAYVPCDGNVEWFAGEAKAPDSRICVRKDAIELIKEETKDGIIYTLQWTANGTSIFSRKNRTLRELEKALPKDSGSGRKDPTKRNLWPWPLWAPALKEIQLVSEEGPHGIKRSSGKTEHSYFM